MPDPTRNEELMRLFGDGAELDADGRRNLVARVRQQDELLADELARMLEIEGRTDDGFLAVPVAMPPSGLGASVPEIPGYVDLYLIGEGGMGSVYRARQVSPVKRTVAIKTIRPGADSKQVLARFELEQQALARMGHAFIATVHDAGLDGFGRPFLVMEFVEGVAITDFCDREELSLNQRLELLAKVCDAIEHAHRRGVMHRDLKPSNCLVTDRDGEALPKIIDFGIAKALAGPLGEQSVYTMQGALLGTPEYMSPEQLDGANGLVDTRTDVYALGVLLYELICGRRPFDASVLQQEGITAWIRLVRQVEPAKPSTRLLRRDRGTPTQTNWTRRLTGDLDWVAMKALAKDPDGRYQSARELAEDLRRFLANLPVEAGPPSAVYRMRKFMRRYRGWVVSVASIFVLLAAGLIGMSILAANNKELAVREQAARTDAEQVGEQLRASLYRSQMRFATTGLDGVGGITRLREVVDAWRPKPPQVGRAALPDLRGFEWRLLEAESRRELRVMPGMQRTDSIKWLTDGRLFGRHYQTLQSRDVSNGSLLSQWLLDPSTQQAAIAISGDGKRMARSAANEVVAVFDVASGEELMRFSHPYLVIYCDLSHDGSLLWCEVDQFGAYIWDTRTQQNLIKVTGHMSGAGMAHDGSMFAVGLMGEPNLVRTYRVAQPDVVVQEFVRHWTGKHQLTFDASGTKLASSTTDGDVCVWSLDSGTLLLEHHHSDEVHSAAFDGGGRRLAVGCADFTVYVHDLESGEQKRLRGHEDRVTAVAWSPDGGELASASDDSTTRIWSLERHEPRREVGLTEVTFGNPTRLWFDASGNELFLSEGGGGTAWNLVSNAVRGDACTTDERVLWAGDPRHPATKHTELVLWSICPETGMLAICSGTVRPIWLWPEGAPGVTHETVPEHCVAMQWIPGGKLAAVTNQGDLLGFDGVTGKKLWSHSVPGRAVAIDLHPNGDLLAIGCADQMVRLWSLERGELAVLRGHAGNVQAVGFSPDGTRLASGGRDHTVRLWDVEAQAEVASLSMPDRVIAVAFSADGTQLGAVDTAGKAVVWDSRGSRHQ